jgi:hypothetical protein
MATPSPSRLRRGLAEQLGSVDGLARVRTVATASLKLGSYIISGVADRRLCGTEFCWRQSAKTQPRLSRMARAVAPAPGSSEPVLAQLC